MTPIKNLLIKLNACKPAVEWSGDRTIEQIVGTCHRGDWLLWLAKKIDLPLNKLTLAKARCAKTVIHLMKDQRSIDAVNIAERFGLDECTLEELNDAAAAATYAAATYAATDAADAAAATAYAAATYAATAYAATDATDATATYAATAADAAAAATAYAADAAYAAATAYAAYAAYVVDAAATADAATDAADARIKNQKETADICREILGDLIINKVNSML